MEIRIDEILSSPTSGSITVLYTAGDPLPKQPSGHGIEFSSQAAMDSWIAAQVSTPLASELLANAITQNRANGKQDGDLVGKAIAATSTVTIDAAPIGTVPVGDEVING